MTIIKYHCKNRNSCYACPIYDKISRGCYITEHFPREWKIEQKSKEELLEEEILKKIKEVETNRIYLDGLGSWFYDTGAKKILNILKKHKKEIEKASI